jgi:hypothetical protein
MLKFYKNQNEELVENPEVISVQNENNLTLKVGEEIFSNVLRKENNNANQLDFVPFFTED